MVFSTQEILSLLPKKLRTRYSRNFIFITQEITNTLLKKFYLYYPRNYEHLTQEIWGFPSYYIKYPFTNGYSRG